METINFINRQLLIDTIEKGINFLRKRSRGKELIIDGCYFGINEMRFTDLEKHYERAFPGLDYSITKPFVIKEPKLLLMWIKSIKAIDLIITVNENNRTVAFNADDTVFCMECFEEPDDFPIYKLTTPEKGFVNIKISELKEILSKLNITVARDEHRFYLQGILFELTTGNKLICTSSDGRRLTQYKDTHTGSMGIKDKINNISAIVSNTIPFEKTLKKIKEGYITITFFDKVSTFEYGTEIFIFSNIEGRFPDYSVVLRETSKHTIDFDGQFITDKLKPLKSMFKASENSLVIWKENQFHIKDSIVNCDVRNPFDDAIGINLNYLIDVVKVLGNELTVGIENDTKPLCFRNGTDKYNTIVMPMKVGTIEKERIGNI